MTESRALAGYSAPPLTAKHLAAGLVAMLWLEAGYAAVLVAVGRRPWAPALWQAALCVAAVPLLVMLVIELVSFPKTLHRLLSKAAIDVLWRIGDVGTVALPWLGWSTLLWAVNGGRWADSLSSAGGVAAFSYLSGALIIALFRSRPRDVQVIRVEVPIAGLPAAFDGYTILHFSDLHAGARGPAEQLAARLAPAAPLDPDLVVFTGDIANSPRALTRAAAAIGALRARDGSLAVLGNHDYWLGSTRVTQALAEQGVRMLINEHVPIRRNGASLYLAGVHNAAYDAGRDDLPAALAGIPDAATTVLLSHTPEIILRPRAARADLILAGHTHGGQIVLPVLGPIYIPCTLGRRYVSGLYSHGNHWLFITRGIGEIFPPLRLLCPPEMALVTLRAVPGPGPR